MVVTSQLTVGTAPVEITSPDDDGFGSIIARNKGPAAVFVGGPDVTAASGFEVAAGESLSADVGGERLWAVTASGTATLHTLELGR